MDKVVVVEKILLECGFLGVPLTAKQIDVILDVMEFTPEEKYCLLGKVVASGVELEKE